MGIDSMAKHYLAAKAKGVTFMMENGKKVFPDKDVNGRTGRIPSVEFHRYPLKDGGYAQEFLQNKVEMEDGRILHFLGLKADGKTLIWPSSKIRRAVLEAKCN